MAERKPQEINDGMDRAFRHEPIVINLLDTPEAQRTEHINSTGFAYKAFPGLQYPRKTHLMGTAKWAQRAYDALQNNGAKLPETHRYLLLATAVLHDIGHAPFCHVMEGVARRAGGKSHEAAAADIVLGGTSFVRYFSAHPAMQGRREFVRSILGKYSKLEGVPHILEKYGVDGHIVAKLLRATGPEQLGENAFLKELLDGSLFDIDKIEYLPRDSRGANIPEGYVDPSRLLNGLRIVEASGAKHLAVVDTSLRDLCRFVAARKYLFAEVYTHRTVLKYEAMLIEAAKRAGRYLRRNGIEINFLTDDELLAHLIRADPVSAELAYDIKYGREFLYDEAYKVKSSDILSGRDRRIRQLAEFGEGPSAEEAVRSRILGIANRRRAKKIRPHEVLVRIRYPYRSPAQCKDKLDLYVYSHKDPSTFAHLRDVVDGRGPLRDGRAREVYDELCKPQTSSYCSVYTRPVPGLMEEVEAAAKALFGEVR